MLKNNLISVEYKKILDVYSSEIPEFLIPFLESPVLLRMSDIWQTCWCHYSPLFEYKMNLSRFEHSLWVALIIWNFTKSKKQTISWLLHDISHSAFSHVWDFILWDPEHQESSEKFISELICWDDVITSELKSLSIEIGEIEDYEIYPIADNPGPQLSADRLEYNLSSPFILWCLTADDIAEIYNDLIIWKDENRQPELSFTTESLALKFGFLSIENDSTLFSSHEAVFTMTYLAEIIKKMLEIWEIKQTDLYRLWDTDVVSMMESSKDSSIRKAWSNYKTTKKINLQDTSDNNQGFISSKCKRRWVDPLIKKWNSYIRLSNISEDFKNRVEEHKNPKEVFIEIPSL